MAYNTRKLVEVLAWAQEQRSLRERWQTSDLCIGLWMAQYDCRTVMCLGGYTVASEGWVPAEGENPRRVLHVSKGGVERVGIKEQAQKILGLLPLEGSVLFAADFHSQEWGEDVAVEFLDHLVVRAKAGMTNMTNGEVRNWYLERMAEQYEFPVIE